jgi:hypothetical protein
MHEEVQPHRNYQGEGDQRALPSRKRIQPHAPYAVSTAAIATGVPTAASSLRAAVSELQPHAFVHLLAHLHAATS